MAESEEYTALRQRRGNASGMTGTDVCGSPGSGNLHLRPEQHPKIRISSQDFDTDKHSSSSGSSNNNGNGGMNPSHLLPPPKSVSLLSLGSVAGAGARGKGGIGANGGITGGIGSGSRSPSTLSASFSSFTNLTASGSAQLKDRLSQLKQSAHHAHHRAVGAIPKVDFAPAAVPRVRRLQTLCVSIYELLMPICLFIFCFACSFPQLWPFCALYMLWVYFVDKAPERGGRSSHWFRSLWFWKYFAEYYPASMRKEQDLPADRPYVFGYHPHGIIGMGAVATFATESMGFSQAFPGIRPHLLTLASNFRMPLYRDILLALGVCSVSRKSCENILRQGHGSAICIVVGGAAESLSAHPGTADLTLRRRLGFIKLAIQSGADLVPVFSFGENDIFDQMPNERGTLLHTLQKRFQSMFGFTLPLFHGRGMLNYNIGLMPYRRRIVAVIGRPINVEKCEKPTLEQVHAVQKLYIEELYRIWDTYKDVFATNRKRELSIID